jgi:hypothetical protein
MTGRRFNRFIDSLSAGRKPKRFRAKPEEAELVRTAVTLRAARPGEDTPSDAFVDNLFQQLSEQANTTPVPAPRPARPPRTRTALVSAVAAVALVTATAVTTEALTGAPGMSAASQVPRGSTLRTGTFQAASGDVLGQIVAYSGHHSWVFMNVGLPHYEGRVTCTLQVSDGRTVAFGTFVIHDGVGQFSKTIDGVDVAELRGAKLVTAGGTPVAAATFGA